MGIFIDIDVDGIRLTSEIQRALVSLCPVEIFALDSEQLVVRPDQVDECTLCELCLKAAPAGALIIHKRYKDEQLVSTGSSL